MRPQPPPQPTQLARLAALTGGAVEPSPDGQSSVVFAPSAVSAPTLARQEGAGPGPTSDPVAAPAPATPTSAASDLDIDDLYDRLASRLRRELIHDADRAGHLLRELP